MTYNKRSSADEAYHSAKTTPPSDRERSADELRGLLQRIADHIAAADQRQQATSGDARTRLDRLAENWPGRAAPAATQDGEFWSDPLQEELRRRASASAHSQRLAERPAGTGAHPPHRHSRHEDQHDGWDPISAEALTRLYEPEHSADPPAAHSGSYGFSTRSGQPSWDRDESSSATRVPNHRPQSTDRLESRIADLAFRIEQALAQLRSRSAAEALDARLASLDAKLGSALEGLPTRADVEQLRALEDHIKELALHVERAHHRLTRLDDIEMHLAQLVEQTSDEHLTQLLDQQIHSEEHISRLAEAVAEHLADRDSFRDDFGAGASRLRELHKLIEQFVSTQRQEQQTAAALEGIQQSVQKLLDRMEALEETYNSIRTVDDDGAEDVSAAHGSDGGLSRPRYPFERADRPTSSLVTISRVTRDTPSQLSADTKAERAGPDTLALPTNGEVSGQESGSPNSALTVAGSAEQAPLPRSREALLADARRAAQKASSEPVGSSSAVRKRAASSGRRASGPHPLSSLLVAALALVLTIGVGVTTYSAYKDEFASAWKFGQEILRLGASARSSSQDSASAASPSTPQEIKSGAVQNPSAPGVSIGGGFSPPGGVEDASAEAGAATWPAGGIVIAPGVITANAQAGEVPVPASLMVPNTDAVNGQPSNLAAAENKPTPPAAIGPLSLRMAAANGDPSAEFEVAVRYDEGRGVARDLEKAAEWYKRSAAKGFAPAQYRLGTLYERGLGVAVDRGRAMAWYKSAAEKGHLKAMHNFAVLTASESSPDFKTAAYWFHEAAKRGLVDSQYNLAILYETGRGVERDLKEAYKWFALAARAGDKEAARRRDRVRWMLSATELQAADSMIRSWEPEPVDRLINDPKAAGEAWKRNEGRN